MTIQKLFLNNYLLMCAVLAWAAAQVAKTIIYAMINRTFRVDRLFGTGGMPSSHSAFVCALFVASAKGYGVSSPIFAITLALAFIVMVDAMGVRLETGKQAKLLNQILEDLRAEGQDGYDEKKLKELVGHTPFQVLSGALLGVLIAILIPAF